MHIFSQWNLSLIRHSHKNSSDQEILQQFYFTKQNEWLGILLQRYTMLLLGVCMQYLKDEEKAKDAVQQIHLKVLLEMQKHQVAYFKSWLYMVAKNHCLMQLRAGKKYTFSALLSDSMPEDEDQDDVLLSSENLDWMKEGMQQLHEDQQRCIELFYFQKKSYFEISETLAFDEKKVKSLLQNGKRNIKIFIEKKQQKNERN